MRGLRLGRASGQKADAWFSWFGVLACLMHAGVAGLGRTFPDDENSENNSVLAQFKATEERDNHRRSRACFDSMPMMSKEMAGKVGKGRSRGMSSARNGKTRAPSAK
ncbi:hypothetical protein V8E51_010244 [Hyaloscypha variabilis]